MPKYLHSSDAHRYYIYSGLVEIDVELERNLEWAPYVYGYTFS